MHMGIPNSHYYENFTSTWYKYKWKDALKMDFLNKFNLNSDFLNNLQYNQTNILDLHY